MQVLNLPSFDYKLKTIEGKRYIFDVIRKKYIFLTPEEWVRQHFIHFLVQELGYPKGRISVERGTQYQKGVNKRTDILIFDENGEVEVLVELKAPSVKLNQSVMSQLAAYNKSYNAKLMIISNGIHTYCFSISDAGEINFLDSIPQNSK